jgi:pSer/pThr/pTyr-binding forkhead associated (FHA) protein
VVAIGRLPSCEVVVADPNASRRHAEVRPQGNGWAVVDLGSTNGTRVNGLLVVGDRLLADGDVIGVGATTVRFEAR